MKNISKYLLVVCLLWAGQTFAQESKPALDTAPVMGTTQNTEVTPSTELSSKPSWAGPRLSYSMNLGASFSNGFGSATYMEPSVRYQVSNRFRVNASMTYINVMPHNSTRINPEGATMLYRNNGNSHYISSVGIDYLASDRLILSGNIWHDFSNIPGNGYGQNLYNIGKVGADFRATYKVTENFTIMGAVRYSDGALPLYSPFYNPTFGNNRTGFNY